nr:MAG TPA: hypothetical protein [Crassvirales sp.]
MCIAVIIAKSLPLYLTLIFIYLSLSLVSYLSLQVVILSNV